MWFFHVGISRVGLEVPATQDMKVGFKKLELLGLPVGDKHMILSSLVLTHYQRVTDRQTDRQTETLRL